MKSRISICILLCLAILATGMAAAQDELVVVADKATYEAAVQAAAQAYCPPYGQAAVASETYGTKVKAGDPDVGLPLSQFSTTVGVPPSQNLAWISYWDIGTNPGFYDDNDAAYLQFGGPIIPKSIRANDIRLTGWGNYPAGSYVKPSDSDMGQLPVIPPAPLLPSAWQTSFYYLNVAGGAGYDMGDPVYLKVQTLPSIPPIVGTNDIRITANAGFPAGSRVSNNDPDAARPLTLFGPVLAIPAAGGPFSTGVPLPVPGTVAAISFFNANGNVISTPAPSQAIYDEGDVVYFDINPIGIVSPNDIRLF